jgi:hypothetical protein
MIEGGPKRPWWFSLRLHRRDACATSISDSTVIRRIPCQPICGWPSEVARLQSDKGGKILDFYFLLRHCRPDSLQVVKMLDGIDFLDLLRLDVRQT